MTVFRKNTIRLGLSDFLSLSCLLYKSVNSLRPVIGPSTLWCPELLSAVLAIELVLHKWYFECDLEEHASSLGETGVSQPIFGVPLWWRGQ